MRQVNIGLIREGKTQPDKRVAFTPLQALEIQQRFPQVRIFCQESNIRCFGDIEYAALGIEVTRDISHCDILFGIKEVPITELIANKLYFFFSHTIKKQPYNRMLLREILHKQIRLVDYEALKDSQGNRLVAFGRYAGIVGAYNGLWTYGRRYATFTLKRAFECHDVNDLKLELRNVRLPFISIILTGAGRVAKGAMEALDTAGIRKVNPSDFLSRKFNEPVYVQLSSADYHERYDGSPFNREEYHRYPQRYISVFSKFTAVADMLIAGAYWNPDAPRLFTRGDMLSPGFKLKIITDITCDIEGSIPSTKRASSISDPIYDYDPQTDATYAPLANPRFVTVMAVDNLPCELPRSSSEEFGRDMIDRILKPVLTGDTDGIITRATITEDGHLTPAFAYLTDYVNATS